MILCQSPRALTVWNGTQAPSLARWRAAKVAGIDSEKVTLHVPLLGGGCGRRLELDMVEEAVAIAMRTQGRPVKLVWSREEDMQHGKYHPVTQCKMTAGIDAGTVINQQAIEGQLEGGMDQGVGFANGQDRSAICSGIPSKG